MKTIFKRLYKVKESLGNLSVPDLAKQIYDEYRDSKYAVVINDAIRDSGKKALEDFTADELWVLADKLEAL